MPQTPERKREYMREYMRQRVRERLAFALLRSAPDPLSYSPPHRLLVPSSKEVLVPLPGFWRMSARKMVLYMKHIQARGQTLEEFTASRDRVDLETGEVWRETAPAYRLQAQAPQNLMMERLSQENATLRARVTQHEADHVVWETGQRYTALDFSEP